jgi:hypothetical protein
MSRAVERYMDSPFKRIKGILETGDPQFQRYATPQENYDQMLKRTKRKGYMTPKTFQRNMEKG